MNKVLIIVFVIGAFFLGKLFWGNSSESSPVETSNQPVSMGQPQISLATDPNPLKLGQATFVIEVKDQNGKPVNDAAVFFDLNMTAMDMGTQQGEATPQGEGKYAATGRLTMSGPWKVSTKTTLKDGTVVNKDFTVNVP